MEDIGVEEKDAIFLLLKHPIVVGVLGFILGVFLGEINITLYNLEGDTNFTVLFILLAFGYLNCYLITWYIKFDQKYGSWKAIKWTGMSFFAIAVVAALLAYLGYFLTGRDIPRVVYDAPEALYWGIFPNAPFVAWIFGGFGLVWWKSKKP